ncbi:hypothetical protein [Pseudomonas mosselii]|uniref:hypothetical protein n=1 Tax=Pseudomonas mosselii TaxID=78327 RepID=UPI001645C6E7|nr:hypothetical protein [Pseudomonas mosselii]MBC3458862.1 hypothetical protein [Pseudomonas mosselii]
MQNNHYPTTLFFKIPLTCEDTGSTGDLQLKEIQAQPLSLEDWLNYTESNELSLRISGKIASKPSWDNKLPPIGKYVTATHTISPELSNTCFALVKGGWVPLIHTFSDAHIIADRNIISEINARFDGGNSYPAGRPNEDFIDYLTDKNCSCTIHTISYALESNEKRLPFPNKIKEQHLSAYRTISRALPHIKIWPKEHADLGYIYHLADSYRSYFNEGVRLLIKLVPLVINIPARGKRVARWREMAEMAHNEGIALSHLAFLAILSASACTQQFNPAHKLIKPKLNYTEQDAYNSMYDLFLIALTNAMQSQAPEKKTALVTRDKNLALFWMGLTFAEDSLPDQKTIGLNRQLLPITPEELDELSNILGATRINKSWTPPPKLKF